MLKINNIKYKKNNAEILKDINIVLNEGEITGIIGRSGSGKTSLLKAIAGIAKYSEGEIFFNDLPLKSLSKKNMEKIIASLFCDYPYDIIDDTLYNFLMQSRKIYKKTFSPFSDLDVQLTNDYIKIFNLNDQREIHVLSLPDGTFKKAQIASQFIKDTDILLLDNPTSNLDMESTALLQKAILKYSIDGDKIIIIACNDINFLMQTADKILIMDEGRIDAELCPDMMDAQMINKYFNTEVLLSKNIYNGKPVVHQYLKGIG
jgi:ABC-type cobalamin/Fe3+-siderophores transport system ATPase subunit